MAARPKARLPLVSADRSWSGGMLLETIKTRQLYRSPDGDRWLLARDSESSRVFVRHEPNPPSGGQVSDIEIGEFLSRCGLGPEKQELFRLIGSLVEGGSNLPPK